MLRLGLDFCDRLDRVGNSDHFGGLIGCKGSGVEYIGVYVEIHRLCDSEMLGVAGEERLLVFARRRTFRKGDPTLVTTRGSNEGHNARHSPSATIRGGGIEESED